MLVTERSMGALVVEEGKGSSLVIGGACALAGVGLLVAGGVKGEWLLLGVGAVFAFYGARTLLFFRAHTHRFDRLRRKVFIDAKGNWNTVRREIPFESIADIVIEKAGRKNPPSYYIHYVLRDGERIAWAETYDGAKEETFECARAAREVLGLPPRDEGSPAAAS